MSLDGLINRINKKVVDDIVGSNPPGGFVNSPDRFFVSDGDINVLRALVRELSKSLMYLNRYTPDNQGILQMTDSFAHFSKMAGLAIGYKFLSKGEMTILQAFLDEKQDRQALLSDAVIEESKKEKRIDDNYIAKINEEAKNIDDIFFNVMNSIDHEKTLNKIQDTDYKIPRNDDKPSNGISYGHTDPTNAANNGGVKTSEAEFPEFGIPFDNKSDTISENMNNLTTFNTDKGSDSEKVMFKGWAVQDKNGNWIPDPIRTFTQKTPFSDYIGKVITAEFSGQNNIQKQPPGTIKFFIEKLHGRYGDGSPYKKGKLISQPEVYGGTADTNFSNRMVFAAYIDNFNENFQQNVGSYSFIGRGEEVPIYKSTKRTINLSFSIVADYSIDLMAAMEKVYTELGYKDVNNDKMKQLLEGRSNWGLGYVGLPSISDNGERYGGHIPGMYSDTTESLWHKITFLAQCMYPYYRADGKMKEQPIIRMRLADIYDVIGYIDSYNLELSEFDNMIDLNPSAIGNIPFGVKVNLSMTIIHDNEPSSNFFGFFHRKEFDLGDADRVTGENLSKNNSRGITAEGVKKQSPLSFDAKSTNESNLSTPQYLQEGQVFKDELELFRGAFSDFRNMGINSSETNRKSKILRAMKAYARVSEVADMLGTYYGINSAKKVNGMPGSLGDFATDVKLGNNLGDNNSIVGGNNDSKISNKQNFDDLYGTKNDSTARKNSVNNSGFGDIVDKTIKNISKPQRNPKTIGDIGDSTNQS